jgi:Tol biopolymer transport system component
MLTRRRAFEGNEVSDTLASILRSEPRITELAADTPIWICRLLHRCLQKDPKRRLQHIGDARVELAEADERQFEPTPNARTSPRKRVWPLVAAATTGVAATALTSWLLLPPPAATPVARFALAIPASAPLFSRAGGGIAMSPDGRTLLYVGGKPPGILRHNRDAWDFESVPGAEGGQSPFFSPDGAWIAFFSGVQLKKVPASGGGAVTICEVPAGATGAWGPDDTIVVARDHLYRVPATGGSLTLVLESGGDPFAEPLFVHDSGTVLVRRGAAGTSRIEAVELGTGARHPLVDGSSPNLASTGDLLFLRQGGIWATRFDAAHLAVSGPQVPLVPSVRLVYGPDGALFATARDGSLAYVAGSTENTASLVWLDRKGTPTPALKEQLAFQSPTLSPDGRRVAISIPPDVWIYEFERGSRLRLTTEGMNRRSVWSSDGAQIAFYSTLPGSRDQDLFVVASSGGPSKRLLARSGPQFPDTWSKDGRFLIFEDGEQGGVFRRDLWLLPIGGEPQPLLSTRFYERGAVMSPDGDWLAFVSDESGRAEVYVQRFPGSGPKIPVSTNGGIQPIWARSGRELFYREGETLMAVPVQPQPFRVAAPQKLFEMPAAIYHFDQNFPDYDVAPDGRFLAVRREDTRVEQIHVVLNFAEELRRGLGRRVRGNP